MVTITYDGQSVECDEAEAVKTLRKLKRDAEKRDELKRQQQHTANQRAAVQGFKLLNAMADILDGRQRWFMAITPDHKYYPSMVKRRDDNHITLKLRTSDGEAEFNCYSYTVDVILEDCAGYACAVHFKDLSGGPDYWAAPGVCDEVLTFATFSEALCVMIGRGYQKHLDTERTESECAA